MAVNQLYILLFIMPFNKCQHPDKQKGVFVTHLAGPKTIGTNMNRVSPGYEIKVERQTKAPWEVNLTPKKEAVTRLTTGLTMSVRHFCDHLALYCLRAFQTGRVCARTQYYTYVTFKNYCMMDFINCCEMFEVWQVVHMGECYELKLNDELVPYDYDTDSFLDGYYWQDGIIQ